MLNIFAKIVNDLQVLLQQNFIVNVWQDLFDMSSSAF